jgi:hypothetical protein
METQSENKVPEDMTPTKCTVCGMGIVFPPGCTISVCRHVIRTPQLVADPRSWNLISFVLGSINGIALSILYYALYHLLFHAR